MSLSDFRRQDDSAALECEREGTFALRGHDVLIEPNAVDRDYWRNLWHYRELFYVLAWRDIAIRYKQTVFGIAWAVLRPLLTTVVFTAVFGTVAKLPAPAGVPYPLLVLAGMLPWTFFASGLQDSSMSLLANANLLGKVYFPRLIVPMATIVVSAVDFVIGLILMLGAMAWYGVVPGWQVLLLPFFAALAAVVCVGPGLLVSALNVKYRDLRFIVPFGVQIGLYVSPVGFDSGAVPEQWRPLYALNPMVGVIDGFRWSLLRGAVELEISSLLPSLVVSGVLLGVGIWHFRRTERSFADII